MGYNPNRKVMNLEACHNSLGKRRQPPKQNSPPDNSRNSFEPFRQPLYCLSSRWFGFLAKRPCSSWLTQNASIACRRLGAFQLKPLRFAAATHEFFRSSLSFEQSAGGFHRAFDERPRAFAQGLALLHGGDVLLHVLRRPAARMCDQRKLRQIKTQLREKAQQLSGHALDVVLSARDDEADDLLVDEHAVFDGDLVLHAIQPLGHPEVKRTGVAPVDGRRQQHYIRPMHQRLVNLRHFVGVVHLRDGAWPRASLRTLGVITFTRAKL